MTRNPVVCGRKHCPQCGCWRHVCDFKPSRHRRDGLRSWCTVCERRGHRKRRPRVIVPAGAWSPIESGYLPREPILAELARLSSEQRAELFYRLGGPMPGASELELRRVQSNWERAVYRYEHDESQGIRLDMADQLAIALGSSLAILYGEEPLRSRREFARVAA